MRKVFSSELYKIYKSKIFYAVGIMLLIMNVIGTITTIVINKMDSFSQQLNTQFSNTGIISYQGSFSGDIIFYIILIFTACIITAEYSNGTIRQLVCHGITRWKLIVGQYFAISFAVTILLFVFGILNLLSDTILLELGEVDSGVFIQMNLGIFCMFWGLAGIGTFFSHLFKNGSVTIAISILFIISSNFILPLFTLVTKSDIFARNTFKNMRNIIIDFTSAPEDVAKCSLAFLVIGVITVWGTSLIFTKRDIN